VLWAGAALGTGLLFQTQIGILLLRLRDLGTVAGELTVAAVLIYIAYKWWERRRFNSVLRLPRITIEELRALLGAADAPIIVDVRSALGREHDRRCIPGALEMTLDEVTARLQEFPLDREIVFYCACPNEATAAFAARKLMDRGYLKVRPLLGGLDAWAAAGYDIENRRGTGAQPKASSVTPLQPPVVPQS
jgi:rhodanese-related sulfurtransferase